MAKSSIATFILCSVLLLSAWAPISATEHHCDWDPHLGQPYFDLWFIGKKIHQDDVIVFNCAPGTTMLVRKIYYTNGSTKIVTERYADGPGTNYIVIEPFLVRVDVRDIDTGITLPIYIERNALEIS